MLMFGGYSSPLLFGRGIKSKNGASKRYSENIGSKADIAKKALKECLDTINENKENLPKFFFDWLHIHSTNLAEHGDQNQKDQYRKRLEAVIAEANTNNNKITATQYGTLLKYFNNYKKDPDSKAKPSGESPPQTRSRLTNS